MGATRDSERGSSLIEFAILTPLMAALFLGVVLFGYDFYTYNRLEEAVRAGARFASTQDYDVLNGHDPALDCGTGVVSCTVTLDPLTSAFASRTVNIVLYGTPTASDNLLIEGLTTGKVTVAVDVQNGTPVFVWVKINGYSLSTPAGAVTLSGKPATVFPYVGNFKP